MKYIILKSGKMIDAMDVIKSNGYTDITPDEMLGTMKIFKKNNKYYKFVGWNEIKNRVWEDVKIVEISIENSKLK